MSINENIKKLNIPKNISVIAATKSRSVNEIKEAVDAGIQIIGENYVQEAEKKYNPLKGKVKFHFIGHLQRNKVKKAVEIFDLIVIDSEKIALEINKRAKNIMPVLIEVNIGKEKNKSGLFPEEVIDTIKKVSKIEKIKIIGLMTMAPYCEDKENYRHYFRKMKLLFEEIKLLNIQNVEMKTLSMGMSNSYKIAIEEGATEVRLGTIIFGPIIKRNN